MVLSRQFEWCAHWVHGWRHLREKIIKYAVWWVMKQTCFPSFVLICLSTFKCIILKRKSYFVRVGLLSGAKSYLDLCGIKHSITSVRNDLKELSCKRRWNLDARCLAQTGIECCDFDRYFATTLTKNGTANQMNQNKVFDRICKCFTLNGHESLLSW